jgi:hypothetical protein
MNRRKFLSLLAGVPVIAGAAALGIATPKAEMQTIEGKKIRILTDDLKVLSPEDGQVYLTIEKPKNRKRVIFPNQSGLYTDDSEKAKLHSR